MLLLASLAFSCSGSGDDAPTIPQTGAIPPPGFTFATSELVELNLVVTLDGVPVSGAIVRLESERYPLSSGLDYEALGGTEAFFKGATDGDGTVIAPVDIPSEFQSFDLIVNYPGSTGPYTTEELRTEGGPFAQSSRQTLNRASASLITVALTTI